MKVAMQMREMHECRHKGCTKQSVMMRRRSKKKEFYCAKHWKTDVESKPEFQNAVKRHEASLRKPKPKKRKIKVKRG